MVNDDFRRHCIFSSWTMDKFFRSDTLTWFSNHHFVYSLCLERHNVTLCKHVFDYKCAKSVYNMAKLVACNYFNCSKLTFHVKNVDTGIQIYRTLAIRLNNVIQLSE